jgi:glycosyltransferase involved in cell wall biosynthesis
MGLPNAPSPPPDAPAISLVIPARNEEAFLPRLLDSVELARRRFRLGAVAVEVIVADNRSTDATARLARERGCRVVTAEPRCIAAVRNAGARAAAGEMLAFVDADSLVHPETFNAVERALAGGRIAAGATGVRLDRWSPGILAAYLLLVPCAILLRLDTGLVFCRRRDFLAVGGYNERRLFGEDVQFLWDLRRLGRRRGQRLARLRRVKAVASTRKFDRWGEWHYFRLIWRLLPVMLLRPGADSELIRRYWYRDER